MKHLGKVLLALALLPNLAQAQNFSTDDLEKVIKNDVKKDFEKSASPNGTFYDVKGTDYYVQHNEKGKFMLIFVTIPIKEIPLEKLNTWNEKAIFSRVYSTGASTVFEVPISTIGATPASVKAYFEHFDREYEDFGKFMKK